MTAQLQPAQARHMKALLMLLVATLLWALSFPTIKALSLLHEQVVPGSSNWFITAMTVTPRYVLATLVMLVWQRTRLFATTGLELRQGIELGLFTSLGTVLQNDGLQFTNASTSAFLTQLYALLIPVWVAVRMRRNPGASVWVAGVLVLAGVAILGNFDWRTFSFGRGEWETLLCSVFYGGQVLCLEKREFARNDPARITAVMFATEAVVFLVLLAFTAPSAAAVFVVCASVQWLSLTLVLTLFCTLGAFLIMNKWQPKITAIEAGLIYCVEPIFSSVFALFLPGMYSVFSGIKYANETVTWTLLLGGGLITLANVLVNVRRPPGRVEVAS